MNELALFAGAGGGILGGKLLGWRTVCAVERDPYAASVLICRQNDGLLPPFPIWDDVRTFDGNPWRGVVDVVSGGFPCQDISSAGSGAGIEGERSGLWVEMARIVDEVRPGYVFVENSPMLTSRGLGTVLGDLATLGYDAEWGVLGAADVGAPHQRDRIWIVAYTPGVRRNARWTEPEGQLRETGAADGCNVLADADCVRELQPQRGQQGERRRARDGGGQVPHTSGQQYEGEPHEGCRQREAEGSQIVWGDWAVEPAVGRVAHGVASRVDRLKALGNGQVPQCAAEAFRRLALRIPR